MTRVLSKRSVNKDAIIHVPPNAFIFMGWYNFSFAEDQWKILDVAPIEALGGLFFTECIKEKSEIRRRVS